MANRLHSLRDSRAGSVDSVASASSIASTTSTAASTRKLPLESQPFRDIARLCNGRDIPDDHSDASGDDSDEDSVASEDLPDMSGRIPTTQLDHDLMLEDSDVDLPASKQAWREIWEHQRHAGLALAVMKHEIEGRYEGSATIKPDDTHWAVGVMTHILQSTEDCVIETVAFGNLALDRRRNQTLANFLVRLWSISQHMPSIYHQQFVNQAGESPSPIQLGIMIDCMRSYVKGSGHPLTKDIDLAVDVDNELAHEIDSVWHSVDLALSEKGFRWYLWKEKDEAVLQSTRRKPIRKGKQYNAQGYLQSYTSDYTLDGKAKVKVHVVVEDRVREVLHFCSCLEERLDEIPEADWDKPLKFPLVEVGYSNRSIIRLANHSAHIGSNYVMNLMESIAEVLQLAVGDFFQIEQAVIYLIWKPEQAEIAEIGWTKLAEGYTGNGGGFSHYPAGRSNYSAQTVHSTEWAYAMQVALRASPLRANIEQALHTQIKANEVELKRLQQARPVNPNEAIVSSLRKEVQEKLLEDNAVTESDRQKNRPLQSQARLALEKRNTFLRLVVDNFSQLYDAIIEQNQETAEFPFSQLAPAMQKMFEAFRVRNAAPSVLEQISSMLHRGFVRDGGEEDEENEDAVRAGPS